MKEKKTYNITVESSTNSSQESAKAKPGESHLDAIQRIYGRNQDAKKDLTELIVSFRENGYYAVADFLEYGKKQASS